MIFSDKWRGFFGVIRQVLVGPPAMGPCRKEIVPMVLARAGPLPLAGRLDLPEVENAAAGLLRGSRTAAGQQAATCRAKEDAAPAHTGPG